MTTRLESVIEDMKTGLNSLPNWSVIRTGGNCTAWTRTFEDGYCLVTDDNGSSNYKDSEIAYIGLYTNEGECIDDLIYGVSTETYEIVE